MKIKTKIILLASSLIMIIGGFLLAPSIAYAQPYTNETSGPNGQLVASQQSYLPERKIVIPVEASELNYLSAPEDMASDILGNIFIADTSNRRVIELSYNDGSSFYEITSFENEGKIERFKNPTGVAVNHSHLFVADKGNEKIYIFKKNTLELVKAISRPDSYLVGSTTRFIPMKVAADENGNIYTVLEGCNKGVMQLDFEGNFISYIGANSTEVSLLKRIQSFFGITSDDTLLSSGSPVTNIALDNKGLLYTVTNNTGNAVKKLNTSGNAILSMNVNEPLTVQTFVDDDGIIFTVQSDGYVTIYDSYGSLLFRFGGKNTEEIMGALKSPVAASTLPNGNLLILDKEANIIIEYSQTYFAKLVYKACSYYKEGLYLEGEDSWNEVLTYNSKFILAYKALAKASMKKGDYYTALTQFKLAEDKAGYSDAYWQVRDIWLRNNLVWIFVPIICLVGVVIILKLIDKKKPELFTGVRGVTASVKDAPVSKDIFTLFSFMRHPRDVVYEIKFKKRVSLIGAILLYAIFVTLQILKVYMTGYLFNDATRADGVRTILFTTIPLLLLVICNYYVSSVRDGEGKFADIFKCFIYSLAPYIVLSIPLFLISNILTYNEQVIYYILVGVIYAWCAINVILTVMELHDYSLGKALINILLTLVCFILVIAFVLIVYVLGYQIVNYFGSLIKEATLR